MIYDDEFSIYFNGSVAYKIADMTRLPRHRPFLGVDSVIIIVLRLAFSKRGQPSSVLTLQHFDVSRVRCSCDVHKFYTALKDYYCPMTFTKI